MYIHFANQLNTLTVESSIMAKIRTSISRWHDDHAKRKAKAKAEAIIASLDPLTRYDIGISDVRDSGIAALVSNHPAVIATNHFGKRGF